mmetsp:Transcript_26485/g.89113  ORF Transcript_26485/g.89113 Transcript_26485/m.89113 type:complete len:286 (+) Transcript_26485:1031-1888(+)
MAAERRRAVVAGPPVRARTHVGRNARPAVQALVHALAAQRLAVGPDVVLGVGAGRAHDVWRVYAHVAPEFEVCERAAGSVVDADALCLAEAGVVDVVALFPGSDAAEEEGARDVWKLSCFEVRGPLRDDLLEVELLRRGAAQPDLAPRQAAVKKGLWDVRVQVDLRLDGEHVVAHAREVVRRNEPSRLRADGAGVPPDVDVRLVVRVGGDDCSNRVRFRGIVPGAAPGIQDVKAAGARERLADVGGDHVVVRRAPRLGIAFQLAHAGNVDILPAVEPAAAQLDVV